jgi:hypothetical protein
MEAKMIDDALITMTGLPKVHFMNFWPYFPPSFMNLMLIQVAI